jgi:hypothetical protein
MGREPRFRGAQRPSPVRISRSLQANPRIAHAARRATAPGRPPRTPDPAKLQKTAVNTGLSTFDGARRTVYGMRS